MKTKHLGKHDFKPQTGYKILDPIERIRSSESHGYDFWNAYEFSYLDINKQPTLKVLEIKIPASSDFIISKMLLPSSLFFGFGISSISQMVGSISRFTIA